MESSSLPTLAFRYFNAYLSIAARRSDHYRHKTAFTFPAKEKLKIADPHRLFCLLNSPCVGFRRYSDPHRRSYPLLVRRFSKIFPLRPPLFSFFKNTTSANTLAKRLSFPTRWGGHVASYFSFILNPDTNRLARRRTTVPHRILSSANRLRIRAQSVLCRAFLQISGLLDVQSKKSIQFNKSLLAFTARTSGIPRSSPLCAPSRTHVIIHPRLRLVRSSNWRPK